MPRHGIRMSLIDGGLEISRILEKHPGMLPDEAAKRLRRGPIQDAVLDFEDALEVASRFDWTLFQPSHDRHTELRATLRALILGLKPPWISLFCRGRKKVLAVLTNDEKQCFRAAGLTEKPPSEDVVAWWDSMTAALARNEGANLISIGRVGEQLTIEHEKAKLRRLGLEDMAVEWVSIEDNAAGYDVRSWDLSEAGEVEEMMIEVKTSVSGEDRFFLSRNEWEVAKSNPARYFIYYWEGDPIKLKRILRTEDLIRFIPIDTDVSRWINIEVSVHAISCIEE